MEVKMSYRFEKLIVWQKAMDFCIKVYDKTREFPKEELYGVTSQMRRAALSIILNYIEGFARQKKAVKQNFWEISYGSLKETKYLLHFSFIEEYLNKEQYERAINLAEEIGAMLWRAKQSLRGT